MSDAMVAHVRRLSKSKGFARFLLVILASHHNPRTDLINPSLQTLAHETTVSQRYIRELLIDLEALGELMITRGHGRGHSHQYTIVLPYEKSAPQSAQNKRWKSALASEKSAFQSARKVQALEREKKTGAIAPTDEATDWQRRYDALYGS
jgi:hypothetical protein